MTEVGTMIEETTRLLRSAPATLLAEAAGLVAICVVLMAGLALPSLF